MQDANSCGAKTRAGTPCQRAPMKNGRCNLHGGKSLAGMASPSYVDGRRSRYAPAGKLGEAYLRATRDLDYMALVDEMALVTAKIDEMVTAGRMDDTTGRDDILALVEQRRRLAATEAQRVKMAQDTLTGEQAAAFGRYLLESVRRHVKDRAVLGAIQADVLAFANGPRE